MSESEDFWKFMPVKYVSDGRYYLYSSDELVCDTLDCYNLLPNMRTKTCRYCSKVELCSIPDCENRGYFHFSKIPTYYCRTHKLLGMVYSFKRICGFLGCSTTASYGFNPETKQRWCARHKKPGMINLNKRLCNEKGCNIEASYGFADEKVKLKCASHKTDEMFSFRSYDKCQINGCRRARIWIDKTERGKYCKKHMY